MSLAGTEELEKERWGKHTLLPLEIEGRQVPREIAPETTGHGDIFHLKGKYKSIEPFRDAVKSLLIDYNLRENCFYASQKSPS